MPCTSRPMQVLPIILREVEVTDITDITPNMRRLTVAGEQLSAGETNGMPRPEFRSEGFDDHVKLVIPPPDTTALDIGDQEEFRFRWNPAALGYTRDYTVRSVDREVLSFTFDVVRHESGLASDWAFAAAVGDRLRFAGPKTCAGLSEGIDFHLLVADETALPAVGRWLEEAPEGTRGHIVVEVPTAADIQQIPTAADVEIDWLVRGATPPGESTLLVEAVKSLSLPEGRIFAWCAGEALTIAPIRRYLRRDCGLPKEDVEVVGYWRRIDTSAQTPAEADADPAAPPSSVGRSAGGPPVGEESGSAAAKSAPASAMDLLGAVHEMTELLPPVLTRVAVTLGINDLIAAGATTVEAIAAETELDPAGVRVLLTAMCGIGLLERAGEGYRNTATGAVLTGDASTAGLDLDDPAVRDLYSIVGFLDVLRGGSRDGRTRASQAESSTWWDRRSADSGLDAAHRGRTLDDLQYVLDIILDLPVLTGARSVALAGDAGAEVAAALTAKSTDSGRVIHSPGTSALTGDAAWPEVDCTLVLAGLTGRGPDEVRALLARIGAASRGIVIVEPFVDEAETDDHQAEELVSTFATTGHAALTSAEVEGILTELDIGEVDVVDIGWGFGRFRRAVVASRGTERSLR